MSIAAVGLHLPNSECDLGRNAGTSVDGVTKGRKDQKFAKSEWIDVDVSRCRELTFAGHLTGEDNVRHLFTGTDAISYECVGSADRFAARQRNATTLTAVGVGLGYDNAQPRPPAKPAVPAVTISEEPENGY